MRLILLGVLFASLASAQTQKLLALRGTADAVESLKLVYREVIDELYELDKDPTQPMTPEFGQAKGQLNMMQ